MFSKKHDPYRPKKGYIYAISTGAFLGKFFVYMESDKENNIFLSLPNMQIEAVLHNDFKIGLDNKILEFQEKLPKKVCDICETQYNKSNEVNNRLK